MKLIKITKLAIVAAGCVATAGVVHGQSRSDGTRRPGGFDRMRGSAEIRQDLRELARDKRELRKDRAEGADRRELRRDRLEIRRDRRELRRDLHEQRRERRDDSAQPATGTHLRG